MTSTLYLSRNEEIYLLKVITGIYKKLLGFLYSKLNLESSRHTFRMIQIFYFQGMMGQLVKKYVLKKLDEVIPGIYNDANVVLSATHTHSGPAGIRGFTAVFFPDFVEYYIF